MLPAKTALLVLTITFAGCAHPRSEPYVPPTLESASPGTEMRQPTDKELEELVAFAEVVVVGRVIERRNAPEGENFRVEVQEILSERSEGAISVGEFVRVSTFFFRAGRPMARIGKLKQPNRYLFFLSHMERKGWWLHLDDPSGYRLPDADATLRSLRSLRNSNSPKRRGAVDSR